MPERLLFFVEHFAMSGAGAENDAVKLCTALARKGYDVHVICEDGTATDGISVHRGLGRANDRCKSLQPDVTIDWGFFNQADIHRIGGGPHKSFLNYYLRSFPFWLRPIKRLGFSVAKHRAAIRRESNLLKQPKARFLAISDFVAKQAVQAGADPASVRVLYNGVDNKRFASQQNSYFREQIREKHGITAEDVVCLFVAHNLKLKNFKLLAQLFERQKKQEPTTKLLVVGKRDPKCNLANVIYAGSTNAVEKYYAAADILLHPSFYDSFGNVVLEGMSAELPVIVSNCCGVSELITTGKDGYILPVTGGHSSVVKKWFQLLNKLAHDPEHRRLIGMNARQTALAHDDDIYVQRFIDEINECSNRKKIREQNG